MFCLPRRFLVLPRVPGDPAVVCVIDPRTGWRETDARMDMRGFVPPEKMIRRLRGVEIAFENCRSVED